MFWSGSSRKAQAIKPASISFFVRTVTPPSNMPLHRTTCVVTPFAVAKAAPSLRGR